MVFRFLIERSITPIYERINRAFKNTLEDLGHEVLYFEPSNFGSYEQAVQYFLSNVIYQPIDYCIINGSPTFLESYLPETDEYLFELIDAKTIFIHHDDISNKLTNKSNSYSPFTWQRLKCLKHKSIHFCLEYSNFLDLKFLDFEQVYPITHASEFNFIKSPQDTSYNLSFVGHILPNLKDEFSSVSCSHLLAADFWNRLVKLDKKLKPAAISFANQSIDLDKNLDFFEQKFFYIAALHIVTPCFRGELLTRLITRLNNLNLDIFGGDPGYIHNLPSNQIIDNPYVTYHPVTNYSETQYIYANSKINLNITSLQFDDAVVNRVIDVGAVGGFILTDWKPGLQKITSVHQEISYRTIDELAYKINYYLTHEDERIAVAEKLHQDIVNKCTYNHVINYILAKLTEMPANISKPLRIDLGCGSWKPEGFIGVDSYPGSEVDIIADLNENFPFPDNSIDEVRAHDVIEHLPDRIHTMNEIWRICKPNATIDIRVPSTDGRGAFQDPTHVSFWNINSFKYYSIEFPEYITLCRSYGFQGAFRIISLEHEESLEQVVHVIAKLEAIKSNQGEISEEIISDLNLRNINLVIFPDWSRSEELLFSELTNLICKFSNNPDKSQTMLLISTNSLNDVEIDTELLLSSVILNLTLTEGLSFDENQLEISLVPKLNSQQWQALSKKISGRVILDNEDRKILEILKLTTLISFNVDEVVDLVSE